MRARFELESVMNLKNNLRLIGSDLVVTCQKPEDFLPTLLDQDKANIIAFQGEITREEKDIEANLEANI